PVLMLLVSGRSSLPASQPPELHDPLLAAGGKSLLCLMEGFGHGFFNPAEVEELGPGRRLDNGRLEAGPDTACTFAVNGSFSTRARGASFELIHDFFAHHLSVGR